MIRWFFYVIFVIQFVSISSLFSVQKGLHNKGLKLSIGQYSLTQSVATFQQSTTSRERKRDHNRKQLNKPFIKLHRDFLVRSTYYTGSLMISEDFYELSYEGKAMQNERIYFHIGPSLLFANNEYEKVSLAVNIGIKYKLSAKNFLSLNYSRDIIKRTKSNLSNVPLNHKYSSELELQSISVGLGFLL